MIRKYFRSQNEINLLSRAAQRVRPMGRKCESAEQTVTNSCQLRSTVFRFFHLIEGGISRLLLFRCIKQYIGTTEEIDKKIVKQKSCHRS